MLKKLVKKNYNGHVDDEILDVYSEYFKYEIGIELLLRYRILVRLIIIGLSTLALYPYNIYIGNEILAYIIVGSCIMYIVYIMRDCYKHWHYGETKFIYSAHNMADWIMGHYILKKQLRIFLINEEFNLLRKCKKLYRSLVSGASIGVCYIYALEFALQVDNAYLVYGGIKTPEKKDKIYCAHAFVVRDGQVFDTNRRRTISVEDYYKLYKVKEYHRWNYEEYSNPNFKKETSKDFHDWCKENQICLYEYF